MEYYFHQNPKWTIRPCDLDTLTRFCPENETSLLAMDEDGEMRDDPKTLETLAAGDSGFGSQEFSNGNMMGVKKSEIRIGTGRGRARNFAKEKDTVTEDFINRQIQEVLCIQGEGGSGKISGGSRTNSQKTSKTDESFGVTKTFIMPHGTVDEMKRMMKPKSRGRGKRHH